MTIQATSGISKAWLSPTSAAKLLACPAAVSRLPFGTRPVPNESVPNNAGSLAHLAVQRWVETGGWRRAASYPSLAETYRQEAEDGGVTLELLDDGRTTESRLRVQEPLLAEAIDSYVGVNGTASAEKLMYDDDNLLWGKVDLLLEGDNGATVIDLKSGADAADGSLPEAILTQLMVYAMLVFANRRSWPATLAIFSLRTGLRTIAVTELELHTLLTRLQSTRDAWASGHRPAIPSTRGCRYCARRFECTAHWNIVDEWEDPDAIEGILEGVEYAANGKSSLVLRSNRGKAWISGVPSGTASGLLIGTMTRAVRLRRSRRKLHDLQDREIWYATDRSDFRTMPIDN
ncbi:PD-(D/E)XK nuclease family protein [Mycolicibacterium novocastrense]|uniref:PD-(D/E)XK nuclease family protein n=1 Tax=Mycolicibacterium novocastrense TaxID=59813 RepID=A0AAW5SP34_MYCNV|nr:PD-(D/E)XK nuclease family protein [Mycolicibacterium novocastrense]MCV7025979.1 PD-(D/E)XK nuclease family protein [Mycolicibacterium novocastrense]GAT08461.1 uncharacterized protein RMCN_1594 [Mycolicibacterium novocastrense]